ncbi:hypothetical protein V8F20_005135 [Naviculisporaceae sp. PSN 640]
MQEPPPHPLHPPLSHPPPTKATGRRQPRLPKSCGECRRRKQKCIPSAPRKPCLNCAKRWPPVECIFPRHDGEDIPRKTTRVRSGNVEVEVTSSRDFYTKYPESSSASSYPMEWSVYVLPGTSSGSGCSGLRDVPGTSLSGGGEIYRDDDKFNHDHGTTSNLPLDHLRPRASLVICGRGFSGQPAASIGGVLSAIDCVNSEPVENTARNTELMFFFLQFVAPNLVSLDGESMPTVFRVIMLPWMLQSHIFPNIAILMASVVQVLEKGQEPPDSSSEPLAIKTKVLGMINRVLTKGTYELSDVLRSIINLVMIEWFWGAHEESMWAHLKGLRDLVNNHGGHDPLIAQDPIFAACLMLADYAIACGFEAELCVQSSESARENCPPCPDLPYESLASPLGDASVRFMDLKDKLHLSEEAARILDDVQFLTLSINCPERIEPDSSDRPRTSSANTLKIRNTASWMHKRLQALGRGFLADAEAAGVPEEDLVTETIRLTALIYTDAIRSLRPISHVKGDELTRKLCDLLREVSSNRWKMLPGIFLWLVAVATPQVPEENGRDTRNETDSGFADKEKQLRIRYLRRKLATAAQVVGQEQYPLALWYLRSYWVVQRWIVEEGQKERRLGA